MLRKKIDGAVKVCEADPTHLVRTIMHEVKQSGTAILWIRNVDALQPISWTILTGYFDQKYILYITIWIEPPLHGWNWDKSIVQKTYIEYI